MADEPEAPLRADSYDYSRLPAELRNQAMLAQGMVLTKLGGAVERVIDAGNTLRWAKATLPHGEYLPWVQQACGLKERYARKLVQVAEWVNRPHVAGLEQITDTATLFLLSADATPEDVRQWVMERCAAGDPPSRKEVLERKRSAGRPRQPQPAETLALNLIRKGELDRIREALALAERAQVVTPEEVMTEQRLRELGKQRFIPGADADFHRMKDGSWIRLPHAAPVVDVAAAPAAPLEPHAAVMNTGLMPLERAADLLGMTVQHLRTRLTPGQRAKNGPLTRNGYRVEREGRGRVRLTPL